MYLDRTHVFSNTIYQSQFMSCKGISSMVCGLSAEITCDVLTILMLFQGVDG